MRNLKRALSLTLASVMLLGMMVVGSSAAVGYDDVSETDNVEAIEVLQSVEVMVGDERGFGPERPVTRAEMAVVMAKLLSLDYNYYTATCPFNDVYDWARGYVGACYANKILSGRSETVYDPGATVTAVEAALMLMRALGYFQYSNDYADGWDVATVRQGTIIGIFEGVGSSATEPMTRNQVAQMVLNALQSAVVEPDGNTTTLLDPNGSVLATTGKVNYVSVTSYQTYARAISSLQATSIGSDNTGYIVELGERLYNGDLKLTDDIDVFGRPSRKWEYDGKGIGIYAKKELLDKEYVGKVTGKDLYDELGKTTIDEYKVYCYVDGVYTEADGAKNALGYVSDSNLGAYFTAADMNKNNKAGIGGTGTGVKTEVYVDHDNDIVYVVVVNTYLAIADKDYDAKKEEAPLVVYSIKKNATIDEYIKVAQRSEDGAKQSLALAVEDFPSATEIKKDDPLLVTVADGEIQSYKYAEVLEAVTVSSFKKNDNVVSGGTKYSYTTTADYKWADDINKSYTGSAISNLKDRTYNIYLDAYGNLIGIEEVEAVKNYVFITGIDLNGSNITNTTADANAIFLDGSMETIRINRTKSKLTVEGDSSDAILNTWCTYTKSGDIYTVKEVSDVGLTKVGGGIGNVANYPTDDNNNLAQFNQTNAETTADTAVGGKNIRMYGGDNGSTVKDYFNVYGDSDTVYLTAELSKLKNSGVVYGVISDVASVVTGVANADLTAWSDANALKEANADKDVSESVASSAYCSSGIYGLYNDEGLIIAAVVVGEDAGSAKDLVYVHSSGLESEEDNGSGSTRANNDELWTWTRKVIRDGVEVLLTEVGDEYDADYSLANMKQYHWYEIRTNGSGHVTKAVEASVAMKEYADGTDGKPFVPGASQYVTAYSKIDDAMEKEGVETVLYLTNGGPSRVGNAWNYATGFARDLDVKGKNTLAVEGQSGSGIHFKSDVHVVLQYWNKNSKQDEILEGEGVDDLEKMVDIVNEYNDIEGARTSFTYYVSALIKDGIATDIVIFDSYNPYKRPGSTGGNEPEATGNVVVASSFTDSKKPTMTGESKTAVNAFGVPVVSFSATVPEWATGTVTFTYDLFVNDTLTVIGEETSALTIGANQTVTAKNLALSDGVVSGILKPSDEVRVEITDATYSAVKATYVDQDGGDITGKLTAASVAPATITTDAAGQEVKLKVDSSKFGALTSAKLTGLTGLTKTNEASSVLQATNGTVDMMASGETKLATGGSNDYVAAIGNGPVEVEITLTGATPLPVTYSVTGQTAPTALNQVTLSDYPGFPAANDTDGAVKLTWDFTGATNVGAGKAAVVKVKAAALTEAYKYYLSGTIAGKAFKVELSASEESINISALNENFEVKAADLTVTAVPKMAVVKASWSATSAVFEFNCNVDETTGISTASNNWKLTDDNSGTAAVLFVEKTAANRITVYFDSTKNAVAADDTLAITATIQQDGEAANKTEAVTFTFKADGVVNNATTDLPSA